MTRMTRLPGLRSRRSASRLRLRGQDGLTLVELLIALALLGFILLAIAPLFIGSVKNNVSANEYTSINMLARDRLEQLMNKPFNDAELAVAIYPSTEPAFLPDPQDPTKLSTVRSPYTVVYQVTQWSVPDATCLPPYAGCGIPNGAAFPLVRETLANNPYNYKRIDVTVQAVGGIAIPGAHLARVSGFLSNPAPLLNKSVADPN